MKTKPVLNYTLFSERNSEYSIIKHDFFLNEYLAVNLLNQIVEKGDEIIELFEIYTGGRFLMLEVKDTPASREILSSVISDIDAYKELNKDGFVNSGDEVIGLPALVDIYEQHYWNQHSIMWDKDSNQFYLQ